VLSVRDQGRALQLAAGTQAHLSGDLVADEADDPGGRQQPQVREAARVDEALDRLAERYETLIKIASTTARPARRSPLMLRKKKARPSGIAVRASPKLWIRSASSATLSVRE
jgi:hypothetical protein